MQQNFSQKAPNLVWASDFTYIKAGKPDAGLVITTFQKAYQKRNAPNELLFHSDRSSQYTAFSFRQLLDSLHVVQSFSKKGYPFDNAVCECFFKYLKKEETNRRTYRIFIYSLAVIITILTQRKIRVYYCVRICNVEFLPRLILRLIFNFYKITNQFP
ncbi:MAG: DDE-type integrase/transposase/recombinase [Lachnospiraceae bacterium]|nr:DDE-type integrase/transposase/recombinase [Lachnospiraceae bacterium]MBP3458987.1 DDE-type integrase/transposase/recombinase [Lachnospiraceae bacterium]